MKQGISENILAGSDDMCLVKEKDDKSSSSSFEKILSFEDSDEE